METWGMLGMEEDRKLRRRNHMGYLLLLIVYRVCKEEMGICLVLPVDHAGAYMSDPKPFSLAICQEHFQ